VIRNKDGEFEIGDPLLQGLDEQEEGGQDAQEDESRLIALRDGCAMLMCGRGETEIS
jgi:hypothetical protein